MATAMIGRWGNANALRLPLSFCKQLGIEAGSKVDIELDGSKIIIEPADDPYSLRGRMASWGGGRYVEEEIDWGPAVGEEIW